MNLAAPKRFRGSYLVVPNGPIYNDSKGSFLNIAFPKDLGVKYLITKRAVPKGSHRLQWYQVESSLIKCS